MHPIFHKLGQHTKFSDLSHMRVTEAQTSTCYLLCGLIRLLAASTFKIGTYHKWEQQRLRRACANSQSHQSSQLASAKKEQFL